MTTRMVVAGPGTYGLSFAGWAARRGIRVSLAGRNLAHGEAGVEEIIHGWQRSVRRGHMLGDDIPGATANLQAADSLEIALEGAEVVLEALPEDLAVKGEFWRRLAGWNGLHLSGSSSIPMARIREAAGAGMPILGFHGFVPMDRMGVIELVLPPGSEDRSGEALALAQQLGKRVAQVQDQTGFAASRMALAQGLEAMRLLESGVASREDLDALMTLGYGHPLGPLELSDRIGLDLRLAIAERIHAETGQAAFKPPSVLCELVTSGRTGRAAGQGFYEWDEGGRKR